MTNSRAIVYACPDKGLFSEGSKVSSISSYKKKQSKLKLLSCEQAIVYGRMDYEQLHKPTELKTITMTF